jgi:hypothetical protein
MAQCEKLARLRLTAGLLNRDAANFGKLRPQGCHMANPPPLILKPCADAAFAVAESFSAFGRSANGL